MARSTTTAPTVYQLMKLADFYIARFDIRREFEWKVTLGLWGVLLGSILARSQLEISLAVPALVGAAVLIVVLHGYWLWSTWRAHRQDKDTAFQFSSRAAKLLQVDLDPFVRVDFLGLVPPAMAFQLLVTILLVASTVLFYAS